MPTLVASKDASAFKGINGTDYTSDWNGNGQMLPCGVSSVQSNGDQYVFRSVIDFDFNETLYTGISSATLTINYFNSSTSTDNAIAAGTSSNRTLKIYLAPSEIVDTGGSTPFPGAGYTSNGSYNFEDKMEGYLTTPSVSVPLTGTIANNTDFNVDVTALLDYVVKNKATTTFRGFLLRQNTEGTSTANASQWTSRNHSNSARHPSLTFTATSNTAPNAPTSLAPTAGARVTSQSFTGTLSDPDSGDSLSAVQILVGTASGVATSIWDSGEVTASGTSFTVNGSATLTANTLYYWKARTKDAAGLWGPYSDGTDSFYINNKPSTPSNLLPTGGSEVTTLTPTFTGTASDPDSGDYLASARVIVKRTSDNATMWDSGFVACGAASFTLTYGTGAAPISSLSLNTNYYWTAQVKDTFGATSSVSSSASFKTFASGISNMTPTVANGNGWVKTLTPQFNFTTPVPMNQYKLTFYDANGNATGATVTNTLATPATTLSTPYTYALTPALAWGTKYYWTAQFRDTSVGAVLGTASSLQEFWTNAAPVASNIYPTNNLAITATNPTFTVGFSDQDLAFGDTPSSLSVEVSRASDSLVMYTMTKTAGLASVNNTITQSAVVNSSATATVTGVTAAGGIVTYTCAAGHPFGAGQIVSMTGINPTAYNLSNQTILSGANAPTATTFKVTNAATGTFVSGGTATSTWTNGWTTNLAKNTLYRYRSSYIDSSASGSKDGTYTGYVFFKPTDGPTIALLTDATYLNSVRRTDLTVQDASGKLNTPTPRLSYTYTGAFSKAQKSVRLQIYNVTNTNNALYDSGFVLSASNVLDIPAGYLLNNVTYRFDITVSDTDDVTSSTLQVTRQALWTAPAQITGLDVLNANGSLQLTWDQSGEATFVRYNVYRRNAGTGSAWTLLEQISSIGQSYYTDYSAGIGITYEYTVTQTSQPVGSNQVDSDIDNSPVKLGRSEKDNWFIVVPNNDSLAIELYVDSEDRNQPYQEEIFEPFGRSRKVVVRYKQYGVEGNFNAVIPADEVAAKLPVLKEIAAVVTEPVYIKTPFGDVYKAYLGTPSYSYVGSGNINYSVSYIEVE